MTATMPLPMQTSGTMYREEAPHDRKQLARWQAQVDEVVPYSDRLASLYLRWEPGDIWQPVQRYCLWELIPHEHEVKKGTFESCIPLHIKLGLEGEDPRSSGHYDTRAKRWVGGPKFSGGIDRATWEVYRETKRWGLRYWAIQGDRGGHPMHIPWMARTAKKIMNEPIVDPPALGDLPYAEPGAALFQKVASFDKMRQWRMSCDWAYRNQAHLTAEERSQAELTAAKATQWWDEQIGDVLQGLNLGRIGDEVAGAARSQGSGYHLSDENTQQSLASLLVDHD